MEQQLSGQTSKEDVFTEKAVAPLILHQVVQNDLQYAVTQSNIKMNLFIGKNPATRTTKTSRYLNLPKPIIKPGFSKFSFYD